MEEDDSPEGVAPGGPPGGVWRPPQQENQSERAPAVISIPAWRIGGFSGLGWDVHLNVHYTPSHGVASTSPSSNKLCWMGLLVVRQLVRQEDQVLLRKKVC